MVSHSYWSQSGTRVPNFDISAGQGRSEGREPVEKTVENRPQRRNRFMS